MSQDHGAWWISRIEGVGLTQAMYVFDPGTFMQARQMRYRPTIESDFSVLVRHRKWLCSGEPWTNKKAFDNQV